MRRVVLQNGKIIGEGRKPYIVAEANSSHNGSITAAKEMVKKASEIGCDCIKFQSWSAETLYSKSFYRENPISGRIVKKFSLTLAEQKELAGYCKECGIDFASTPYAEEEVDFLVDECKVPFIKIASMELNNYPFLNYIASKHIPIVLATGMGNWDEIQRAVEVVQKTGNPDLCILHCVSVYPADYSQMNLLNIKALMEKYPEYVIGLSDHSAGTECGVAAVAMGAGLIEKHFTLDNSRIGMDNQMAAEPHVFKELVDQCCHVFQALGSEEREVTNEEMDMRNKMRRSVVTTRKISAGEILKAEDLTAKRPGNGLPPEMAEKLIGKTVLRDLDSEAMVSLEDIN
ncbi:MAG: N-acetylneuraminate synthase family protein [Lachnospiraceae bacterium]|nr:N-acetylneuraminate synthase family protein [Lachnospiraceae bacterium]